MQRVLLWATSITGLQFIEMGKTVGGYIFIGGNKKFIFWLVEVEMSSRWSERVIWISEDTSRLQGSSSYSWHLAPWGRIRSHWWHEYREAMRSRAEGNIYGWENEMQPTKETQEDQPVRSHECWKEEMSRKLREGCVLRMGHGLPCDVLTVKRKKTG